MPREFAEVRCPGCKRLLYKMEPGALTANRGIECKCEKCKRLDYRIGPPRAAKVSPPTT